MSEKHIPPQKPYLQIKDVVKTYGENYAVDHIDLDIDRHEIFALLGSSGSGKSTLLRMLAGMETPDQGKIILDGQDITRLPPYDRPINMKVKNSAAARWLGLFWVLQRLHARRRSDNLRL